MNDPPADTSPTPPGPGVRLRLRATIDSVPKARHALADWLQELDVPKEVVDDLALAATELVTNAVEASPSPAAEVVLQASYNAPDIYLQVTDCGPGFSLEGRTLDRGPGPQSLRGRGLPIVKAVVDLVAVQRHGDYTTVVATRRLAPAPVRA